MSIRHRDRFLFGLFVILLLYSIFTVLRIYPIALSFWLSLRRYDLIGFYNEFVGFTNFVKLFGDHSFWVSLKNTIIIAIGTVPLSIFFALLLGLFFNAKFVAHKLYQLIFFAPVVMPTAATALIWKWMYQTQGGLLNYLLSFIGIGPIPWLTNPDIAVWAVTILWIWKWVGYFAILFLVGLQNIPNEYIEAARIDGGNPLQIFFRITLPLLKPITLFIAVICTLWTFQMFDPVYILTSGSQGAFIGDLKVIVYDMYTRYFTDYRVGYATAEGVILFLLLMTLSLIQTRALRTKD